MPPNGNVDQGGRAKKRGRPSKADKLAIELARRVAGAVSAAAAAAKASAAKAREQVIKRRRGRPPKPKPDVKLRTIEEESEEEPPEVMRPKSRRKGEPKRAPGSTADWFQRPPPAPLVKRQPRDIKHLDIAATKIGKREKKRNPKFDEFVTFSPRKVESSVEETSRNRVSAGAVSEAETESNAGLPKQGVSRESSTLQDEGVASGRWNDLLGLIDTLRDAGMLGNEETEQLKLLAEQHDKLLEEAIFAVESDPSLENFGKVLKDLLGQRSRTSNN